MTELGKEEVSKTEMGTTIRKIRSINEKTSVCVERLTQAMNRATGIIPSDASDKAEPSTEDNAMSTINAALDIEVELLTQLQNQLDRVEQLV